VLYLFKHKQLYDIDEAKATMKKVPKDFDEGFNYLKLLSLTDDNYDFETRIPARLWVRDLFMKGQTNILQKNKWVFRGMIMLCSVSYLMASILLDMK